MEVSLSKRVIVQPKLVPSCLEKSPVAVCLFPHIWRGNMTMVFHNHVISPYRRERRHLYQEVNSLVNSRNTIKKMPSFSKHSFKRKQLRQKQKQPRQKRLPKPETPDRDVQITVNRCDLCNNSIPETGEDLEYRMDVLAEINDSYESELDKTEPRLMLCKRCSEDFKVPSYC